MRRRALLTLLAATPALAQPAPALRVIATGAVEAPLRDLAAAFTRQAGLAVEIVIGNAGQVASQLRGPERFDLVCNAFEALQSFITEGLLDPASLTELGRMRLGLGVRAGAPLPDIATPTALRDTLLAAKSIAVSDPRGGATSGKAIAAAFETLGLTAILAPRLVMFERGSQGSVAVADGRADLILTQISEIVVVPGVTLVAPLPESLQLVTSYRAAILRNSGNQAGAHALLKLMTGPAGRTRFQAGGFAVG
jgi:molybdate transport system substrate-binding protein